MTFRNSLHACPIPCSFCVGTPHLTCSVFRAQVYSSAWPTARGVGVQTLDTQASPRKMALSLEEWAAKSPGSDPPSLQSRHSHKDSFSRPCPHVLSSSPSFLRVPWPRPGMVSPRITAPYLQEEGPASNQINTSFMG